MYKFCQNSFDKRLNLCYIEGMDTVVLRKAGLTESQAKGYLALVEHGALTPVELATHTGENRTNAYAIADKLVDLGLATKKTDPKTLYSPESPTKLKQLLVNRQRELRTANEELLGTLPTLLSQYQLVSNRPGVVHLEGVGSLRQVYDDIIRVGDVLRIFPSNDDRDDPEVSAMIDRQIERQRKAGVKTEVLLRQDTFETFPVHNDELFEARPALFGPLGAQIMIYGNNIAITTYTNGIVTTIITNPMVADTFRQLFQTMWAHP